VLAELGNVLADTAANSDVALARKAVKRANDRRRARQIAWTGAGVLAAAASIAIVFRVRHASAPVEIASSSTVDARGSCIQVGTTAAACFDTGTQLDGATTPGRFYLSRGHVVAALKPLPPGTEFSISTPHGKATVVGTQFAVDVAPDGSRTEVRVIKGKVRVTSTRTGAEAYVEKGHYAILGDNLETGALGETDRDQSLLTLAKQGAGIGDDLAEDIAPPTKDEAAGAEAPKGHPLGKAVPGASLAQPASAADLLEEARCRGSACASHLLQADDHGRRQGRR
jgi:ferric-dicitrate binding protein FerR (iron transport regulator)